VPIDAPYEGHDFYCDVALPRLAELDLVHRGAGPRLRRRRPGVVAAMPCAGLPRHAAFFDDVFPRRPRFADGVELVAVRGAQVVGICDASIDAANATIESIVVHPDHRRRGIAHALAETACRRLSEVGATTVDAWTRDDVGTLAWYRAEGFAHEFRYLHVYASTPDEMVHAATAFPDLMARNGHFHAWQEHEERLRATFARVHGCNRVTKLP